MNTTTNTDLAKLIDLAIKETGSQRELAALIGCTSQNISDFKAGRRNASPEEVALIADAAGFDATAWLVRAVIEKNEGKPRAARLLHVLGKSLPAITALVAASSGHAAITGELVQQAANWHAHLMILLYTMYITLTFRMTLLGSGVMSAGMWNASSYEEALLHCTSQSFASSCLQRHAPLSYSLCCCSDDDLDAPGGVCEVGLHGGARGAVCRVDPGVPYLIHAADVLDVAQKDLAHEDA